MRSSGVTASVFRRRCCFSANSLFFPISSLFLRFTVSIERANGATGLGIGSDLPPTLCTQAMLFGSFHRCFGRVRLLLQGQDVLHRAVNPVGRLDCTCRHEGIVRWFSDGMIDTCESGD